MNVIIMFENGEIMDIMNCTGYEVQAGGDICSVKKTDGGKIVLNFRKVLFICEKEIFMKAELTKASASGAARKK